MNTQLIIFLFFYNMKCEGMKLPKKTKSKNRELNPISKLTILNLYFFLDILWPFMEEPIRVN